MKRILAIILILIMAYAEIGFAHSGFIYGTEGFEAFVPSADGTSFPDGLYAQNFEKTTGGAGIYSADGIDGKCAVIKTTSTRGYTQMAYKYESPTQEVTCFGFDICMNDTAVPRDVQIRFGDSTVTGCNVLTFETDGDVMLGSGYISGFEWEIDTWYHTELTVNPVSGKISAVISGGGDTYKSQGTISKTGSIYSIWLTNNSKANAVTLTDNWNIKSCIEPLDIEYYDNFNSYSNSIVSGASGCNAGTWSMPVNSGKVTYEAGVSEEKGGNLKMTTVSTTNAQNLEYVLSHSDYTDTIGYDLSVKLEDVNTEKRFIIRDSSRNTLMLGRIAKNGALYWGSKSCSYVLETNKWYDISITYNMICGYSQIKISDGTVTKTYNTATQTRANVKYAGIANMAYSSEADHGVESVIYIDDFAVYEKNPSTVPIMDTSDINSVDELDGIDTTGVKTMVNGENALLLSNGEYVKIPEAENVTYTADIFMKSASEADIKIGNSTVLKISGENVCYGSEIIGKISVWNWYKICVTIDTENNVKYITVSDDGRLIAQAKGAADVSGDFSVVCNSQAVYLDNIGTFASKNNISYIYTSPENTETKNTSFAEIVFPNFIDKDGFEVYLNGKLCDVKFVGDKTVRIENLNTNTYYHVLIENARDLYGNYINSDIEFQTGYENIDVRFANDTLESGEVSVTVTAK